MTEVKRWREALARAGQPLPGSIPYTNHRRMNVGKSFEGDSLQVFLTTTHPHIDLLVWERAAEQGRLLCDGRPSELTRVLRAGNQITHIIPNTVEPPVNAGLRLLHHCASWAAFDKPAPLPVHPCGRFNKNTVTGLLELALPKLHFRPVHRLDADTTGLLLMATSRKTARELSLQFETRTVQKSYLALVEGLPPAPHFESTQGISAASESAGRRRASDTGKVARASFERLGASDRQTLLLARPSTGRTNQLRLQLAHAGFPIVGDETYRVPDSDRAFSATTTLHLHAWKLAFRDPDNNANIELEAPAPDWAQPFLTTAKPEN